MISAAKFDAPNMAAPVQTARALRFDIFELDLRAGELRKRGVRLRLQGQPLQVLAALLRRAGEVVTREELRGEIWAAGTFVDFDHSLHNAIARIREALGDSAEIPRYIETLPRRGYKFIAPVEEVQDEQPPSQLPRETSPPAVEPVAAPPPTARPHTRNPRGLLLVGGPIWDLGGVALFSGQPVPVLLYVLLPFFPWQILVATPPRTTSPMA